MKLSMFQSPDEKLRAIGFNKVDDNEYGVHYERLIAEYGFTQVLSILHKKSGRHIVQSYDKDLVDSKNIGNTGVGLTYYEMKLAMRKMKEKGWHKP